MPAPAIVRTAFGLLAVLGALAPSGLTAQAPGLFGTPSPGIAPVPELRGDVLRSRVVAVDFRQLERARDDVARRPPSGPASASSAATASSGPLLLFNLFDDRAVTVVVENASRTFSGGYALTGRPLGERFGSMTVAVNGDVLSGTLRVGEPTRTYEIRSQGGGSARVSEVSVEPFECTAEDHDAFAPGLEFRGSAPAGNPPLDLERPFGAGVGRVDLPSSSASTSVLDVAFFYTLEAKAQWQGDAGVTTKIEQMIAGANAMFSNSSIDLQLNAVTIRGVNYNESAGISDATRLESKTDGFLDGVHTVRDEVWADVVVLIRQWNGGHARVMLVETTQNEHRALMVSGGGHDFILAHEVGHLLGLRHDRYVRCNSTDCGNAIAADAYGYVNQAAFPTPEEKQKWRTLMAYWDQCREAGFDHCHHNGRFSDPTVTWREDPMGVALTSANQNSIAVDGPSNAVRVANMTRDTVAEYRAGRSVKATFDATSATATEGGSAASLAVSLDVAPGRALTIPLTVSSTSAWSEDYDVPTSVSFTATETSKTVTVTASDDAADDDSETIAIGFGELPAGVRAGDATTATVSLADDDTAAGAPAVDRILFRSTPSGDAYGVGNQVEMAVVFDAAVVVTGTPVLALTGGFLGS